MSGGWTLRRFESSADYEACVALQEEIWGPAFAERVPAAILKVSQEVGGVSAGAFDDEGRLLGFVFGLTGLREGRLSHWSDMLAVRPEMRGRGLGIELKRFQRDAVLALGVEEMLWTFDPLRAGNAHLNLNKLGAVVRAYRADMYGATGSPLHDGIGTDRFVAFWPLRHERVVARLSGGRAAAGEDGAARARDAPAALAVRPPGAGTGEAHPRPGEPAPDLDDRVVTVAIPADIGAIMERDAGLARAWRQATRAVLTSYFGRGYEARALLREGPTCRYLLERDPEPAR